MSKRQRAVLNTRLARAIVAMEATNFDVLNELSGAKLAYAALISTLIATDALNALQSELRKKRTADGLRRLLQLDFHARLHVAMQASAKGWDAPGVEREALVNALWPHAQASDAQRENFARELLGAVPSVRERARTVHVPVVAEALRIETHGVRPAVRPRNHVTKGAYVLGVVENATAGGGRPRVDVVRQIAEKLSLSEDTVIREISRTRRELSLPASWAKTEWARTLQPLHTKLFVPTAGDDGKTAGSIFQRDGKPPI